MTDTRRTVLAVVVAGTLAACGGGGGGSPTSPGSPGTSSTPAPTGSNTVPVRVTSGPTGNDVNLVFVDVTICVPGGACQTIPDIQVDTGSTGLRLLASKVTLPLERVRDAGGNALGNCVTYADESYTWGPMVRADVRLGGERADAIPIQLVGDPSFPDVPDACNAGDSPADTVDSLGANGLLGVGVFLEDCGPACAGSRPPAVYFACGSSSCTVAAVPTSSQLLQPVARFATHNNGLSISFPSVPETGAPTLSGSMVFGIGTAANNALNGARVLPTDNVGNISTRFNNREYDSYIDSGSNGLYLLDSATLGIPLCRGGDSDFYCPAQTTSLSATNVGSNGATAPATFRIASAQTLFRTSNSAFDDLAGDSPGQVAWGSPFFFGRTVFTAIEGRSTPGGAGPYFAY